jgi:hypothetical protein
MLSCCLSSQRTCSATLRRSAPASFSGWQVTNDVLLPLGMFPWSGLALVSCPDVASVLRPVPWVCCAPADMRPDWRVSPASLLFFLACSLHSVQFFHACCSKSHSADHNSASFAAPLLFVACSGERGPEDVRRIQGDPCASFTI